MKPSITYPRFASYLVQFTDTRGNIRQMIVWANAASDQTVMDACRIVVQLVTSSDDISDETEMRIAPCNLRDLVDRRAVLCQG